MAYSYYQPIVIDHTKVGSGDLTNFAVAVFGTFTALKTAANGGKVQSASGFDIQFYSDSVLTTALTFERESWDGATGAAAFWVKIASLSSTVDTTIYMSYGDAGVITDQQNKTAVWDSSFTGVYHCVDARDSTSNTRHGTATGTSPDSHIGCALSFALGDKVTIPSLFGSPTALTMECWASWTGNGRFNASDLLSVGDFNKLSLNKGSGFGAEATDGGGVDIHAGASPLNTGWHHYVFTFQNSFQFLYKDGVSISSQAIVTDPPYSGNNSYIGVQDSESASGINFAGSIDEVRFSNVIRSAGWILANYKNQSDPSTFYTLGSEVHIGGTDYTASLTDSLSLGSSLVRLVSTSKADTYAIASTLTRQPGKAVSDSFSLSETLSKLRSRVLSLLDSLAVADIVARSSSKDHTETLALSESLARATGRAWTETITLAEFVSRSTGKTFQSALSLLDGVIKAIGRSFTETISLSEVIAAARVKILALLDSIFVADTLKKTAGKAYTETVSLLESTARRVGKTYTEEFSISDLLDRARTTSLALLETLNISDGLAKFPKKAYAESLSLVDGVTKALRRGFAETISISELFRGGKIYFVSLLDSITLLDIIASVYHRSVAIIRTFIAELLERLWPAEETERTFTVAQGAFRNMITDITKPSASTEDFRIDWADALGTDIITASEWVLSSTDMQLEANSFSESTATARLGGGAIGKHYVATNHVTLASGQIKSQALQFVITN